MSLQAASPFFDKKVALPSYFGHTRQVLMRTVFPEGPSRQPQAAVPDDGRRIMVIASLTFDEKAAKRGASPFKQIAIELYQPPGGGLAIGGRFAPTG